MSFELIPNARTIHNITFPSAAQANIWKRKQSGESTTEIAKSLNASLAYVSKALRVTNRKIKTIIEDAARSNFLAIQKLSEEFGFCIGYSPMLNRRAYISFSPGTGVHVWYDHIGDCPICPAQKKCQFLLSREAEERNIEFPTDLKLETEKAAYLIKRICEQIGWIL